MKLTKASVAKLTLPPGKSDLLVPDDALPGFGLRLRPSKSTWTVQYRLGGRSSPQRKVTIGTTDQFDVEAARAAAKEILAKVRLGGDPSQEKATQRLEAAQTVGAVAERYIEARASRIKPNSLKETTRYLRQHWAALASVPVAKLDRATVATELAKIKIKSGGYAANRARGALSAMLTWAVSDGLAPSNPAATTNKPLEREVKRDRVLSDAEVKAVWLEAVGYGGDFGAIVRLLILTGQRREEVGGMLWSEIDLDAGAWRIGAARTKNARQHDVPLPPPAVAILRALKDAQAKREDGEGEGEGEGEASGDYAFGRRGTGFSGWSKAKGALDKRALARLKVADTGATLPDWRLHDLRRTAATGMADLGVLPHVVEAVLNHISGSRAGVAGIYNRATYAAEKKAALTLWAELVMTLVGEGN